ncbi:MAG: hypothetical protein JKP98_15120 [Rhodobacteraceae bacterium]|nr:hypothetical protein [Paracoccaceae bacterium]
MSTVFVLTDPDLLNNHGLSLGQNADLAAAVLPALAGTGAVIVDSSTEFWTRTTRVRQPAERSWADLARFFAWPYALIWLGFAALFGLALWRGGVRTRPPLPEATAPQLATVEAEARLLLLSGDRARLLGDYAPSGSRHWPRPCWGCAPVLPDCAGCWRAARPIWPPPCSTRPMRCITCRRISPRRRRRRGFAISRN